MTTSTLSFTIRPTANGVDLRRACEVRAQGYGHHVPGWREPFLEPDALDRDDDTVVLLCEDKTTGEPVGTARIQTNRRAELLIEQSVELPHFLRDSARAEVSRLSTMPGADPLVRIALCKASLLQCLATQSRYMVIGARNEALVRQYRRLGFDDVREDRQMVPLAHAGGVPHRILFLDAFAVERHWKESNHAFYDFFFRSFHPDIDLVGRHVSPQHLRAMAA